MTAQFPPVGYGPPPAYGPPGYGRPRVPRRGNPVGIVLAALGGLLALIGTLVDWYTNSSLRDILAVLDASDVPSKYAFAKLYLGWLMWVLLALTVVTALFANTAGPVSTGFRIVSPIAGGLGAALVLVSLGSLAEGRSIFDNTGPGLWLVLLGFVVAGAGGIIGPRKVRSYVPPGYPPVPPR